MLEAPALRGRLRGSLGESFLECLEEVSAEGLDFAVHRCTTQGCEPLGAADRLSVEGRTPDLPGSLHQVVDLVDDQGLHRAEHVAGHGAGQNQVQRLGGGDQDVRRTLRHLRPFPGRRVPGADGGADTGGRPSPLGKGRFDALERCPQVAVDVIRKGLER